MTFCVNDRYPSKASRVLATYRRCTGKISLQHRINIPCCPPSCIEVNCGLTLPLVNRRINYHQELKALPNSAMAQHSRKQVTGANVYGILSHPFCTATHTTFRSCRVSSGLLYPKTLNEFAAWSLMGSSV